MRTNKKVAFGVKTAGLLFALLLPARVCWAGGISVLFIGNSYVSVNDLPGMFAAIAKSKGEKADVDSVAPGGYTFEQHAKDKNTQTKIASKKWDFVVLQEQSQRPDWPNRQLEEMVTPYALRLDKFIRKAKAKTVFYETWGHKNGDKGNCKSFPETCTYAGMQSRISATYADLTERTGGLLAPVGTAWQKTRNVHPEIDLYSGDGMHPSRAGTYLAACVFYSALFNKNVLGADSQGLPDNQAKILQIMAYKTVFHSDE